MTGVPLMSSSTTASLTESRFKAVVDSAMTTGFHCVTSSSLSCSGAAMT